ncbi:Lipase GDSL [Penicillium odoratum]|uniref:Lipase GDSL n=1 Tax=Penicillium odoratum TaxID=1167516 RepID=UPI0025488FF6|nr:Lipase GDSL [Penicillium odoratum]KAJ5759045.1 Lipase GDSL [Penicillium odoratum]
MRPPIPINLIIRACLLCVALLSPFVATGSPDSNPVPTITTDRDDITILRARAENQFLLRIMPLGASITNGYRSTGHNGYRNWIRQQLRYEGWDVEMVGSLRNGTMIDNFNEGHFGFRVDQLSKEAVKTTPQQPNLILLNAGTDDALQNHHVGTTGVRMNSLLDLLFEKVPNTTIILSTLLPNKKSPQVVEWISDQYRVLAAKRRKSGDRIVLADMSSFIKLDELADATHPTDVGYKRMASVWWAAIEDALQENMIQRFNYTITNKLEKALDNSTSNPNLPSYTAPPQPTNTNHGVPRFPRRISLIVGIFLVLVMQFDTILQFPYPFTKSRSDFKSIAYSALQNTFDHSIKKQRKKEGELEPAAAMLAKKKKVML